MPPKQKPQAQKKKNGPIKRVTPVARGRKASPISDTRLGISSSRLVKGYHPRGGTDEFGDYLEIPGREFVSTITVPTATSPGTVLYQRENLVSPENTRLRQFSPLYYRWRPMIYKYHFVPTQPTTVGGTLVSGVDIEPGIAWIDDPNNIAKCRALTGSRISQLFEPMSFELPKTESQYTDLWCDPYDSLVNSEDRLVAAGRAVMVIGATGGMTAGMVIGLLELEYVVRFYHKRLQNLSDMGTTTSGTIPLNEVFPDNVKRYGTLRKVVNTLQSIDINTIIGGAKMLQQLRNTKLWPDALTDEKFESKASSPVGLPEGLYSVRMEMLFPAVTTVFPTIALANVGLSPGAVVESTPTLPSVNEGVTYGYPSRFIGDTEYFVYAQWDYNFEVVSGSSSYGWVDMFVRCSGAASDALLYYTIACTEADQIQQFSGTLGGAKASYITVKKRTVRDASQSSNDEHFINVRRSPPALTPKVVRK